MRTTSTFSVLFWIHGHRIDKNNLTQVYARITLNGKRAVMSLNQKVDVDLWDSKRQRLKGNSRTVKTINNYLDEVRSDLVICYRDLKHELRVITPQLVKARYLDEDKKIHSLDDIFEYHNDKLGIKLAKKPFVITRQVRNIL
ncbi:Arm DNA-binding domain-containing protein [Muriicola sp.]|uniref:Arm DNA-binding domain-containing protein n=1 Tax=Muriicola sp. TaxID=2020856 RepID=UPI003C740D12